MRDRRNEPWGWLWAVVFFGAGFGMMRWWGSRPSSSAGGSSRDPSSRMAETAQVRADSLEPMDLAVAPAPATTIRKSRLPDWMRFRYEHPRVAFSTETLVRIALDDPVPARQIARACSQKERIDWARDLDISAEVAIQGRDVMVRGWGCSADEETGPAGRICDCLLEELPKELHLTVPPEVPEPDLTPYEGMLSLRL